MSGEQTETPDEELEAADVIAGPFSTLAVEPAKTRSTTRNRGTPFSALTQRKTQLRKREPKWSFAGSATVLASKSTMRTTFETTDLEMYNHHALLAVVTKVLD